MGTRNKLFQTDETRKKIQTSQIINRLADHIDGKNEMKNTQVKAAEILLRKSLPDLSTVELTGDPDKPVVITSTDQELISRYLTQKDAK